VKPTAYLVDASIYVFRAWHSVPPEFNDIDGNPVHAVYGFTGFLITLLEQTRAGHLAVAFDESLESSFRNEIYPPYKANREPAPEELKHQFRLCQEVTAALGLTPLVDSRYEADDIIGTLVHRLRGHGFRSVIVSPDKDLSQLLGAHDRQWDFARRERWGPEGVEDKFGVRPDQLADLLALAGDSVDNIPGVPGIGVKTAAGLLRHFGDLESLLARVEEVPFLSLRGAKSTHRKLREHAAAARLARRLTGIALDAPAPAAPAAIAVRPPDPAALEALFDRLRFGPLTRRRAREATARVDQSPG
jgi:DNA polymerase I